MDETTSTTQDTGSGRSSLIAHIENALDETVMGEASDVIAAIAADAAAEWFAARDAWQHQAGHHTYWADFVKFVRDGQERQFGAWLAEHDRQVRKLAQDETTANWAGRETDGNLTVGYTPDTGGVRDMYAMAWVGVNSHDMHRHAEALDQFDRWLAEHDTQVRAEKQD